MKHYNIYNNSEPGLENFSDNRGTIADIFFKQSINHGCIITNSPGAPLSPRKIAESFHAIEQMIRE